MRKLSPLIISLLLALLLGVLGIFFILKKDLTEKKEINLKLRVERGVSLKHIVEELCSRGVVDHPEVLYYWARYKNVEPRAGCYRIEGRFSAVEVLKELEKGTPCLKEFTVPPGSDLFLLDRLFSEKGICKKGELLSLAKSKNFLRKLSIPVLSGFLYPDTYYINEDSGCREAVKVAVRRFKDVVYPLYRIYNPPEKVKEALGNPTLLQIVTVASIVEKETSVPEEKPLIAAVIYNRLARGMKLQCDPTVIYALKLKGIETRKLTYRDLSVPSPFNTYMVKGLPPEPICNPSLSSIEAAFYPADVDYLYFVANGRGRHVFSRSYNQHVKNVEKLRIWQRRNGL